MVSKSSAATQVPLATFTCKSCRQRKRRCSREKPRCERCARLNIPCVYELPPKHLRRMPSYSPVAEGASYSGQPQARSQTAAADAILAPRLALKAQFSTSLSLASHLEKDPFVFEFAVSAIVCGPQLASQSNTNSMGHVWFALTLLFNEVLKSQTRALALPRAPPSAGSVSPVGGATLNSLVGEIASALPPMVAVESYKIQFYQNVYTAMPVLNIQRFELFLEKTVLSNSDGSLHLNVDSAERLEALPFLAILLIVSRMGYMCLCLTNERAEADEAYQQELKAWLCENPVSRDVVGLVKRCLDIYENPTEMRLCCLIYLRELLVLEDPKMWMVDGMGEEEMLNDLEHLAISLNLFNNALDVNNSRNDSNATVQEQLYRRKLWLSTCSISLHEHTLNGGSSLLKANQIRQFSDHQRVFDDYRLISQKELPLDDQIELDYHIMLLKNHQFMEALCDIEESHHSNEDFLVNKIQENERLSFFFKEGFPEASTINKLDLDLPLHLLCNAGQIPINIGSVKQIAVLQTRFALLVKQLSNASLLMFYFEKEYKHSCSAEHFESFEDHLFDCLRIVKTLFNCYYDYSFGHLFEVTPKPMRYILANTMSPVYNRVTLVLHGLTLRFSFSLNLSITAKQPERLQLLKSILASFRSILSTTNDCMAMEFLVPAAKQLNSHFLMLLDCKKLFSALNRYESMSMNDIAKSNYATSCLPGYAKYYSVGIQQLSIESLKNIQRMLKAIGSHVTDVRSAASYPEILEFTTQ
ncbi:LADA_0G03246g1_1 [Lachancea dasiensis]|uniref:LADA_0G03246g1_1 n=1 Tax=Lachancea dasiensis TaxID=1072105 RepID=A0A1G4JRJ8_9SACH|nr:LADA_0G03246g1_1 [Lachancea dasiensis]